MEKNIRTKVNHHEEEFKKNLCEWIGNQGASLIVDGENRTTDFLQYLNDFPGLQLCKEDFQKRKRVKNNVPDYNRCIALKCNGERCSRKQKHEGVLFCGTHMKGANYGTTQQVQEKSKTEKVQLWLQEINGIMRYVDKYENVYCMEDILNHVTGPRVVGKYGVREDNVYYMRNN